MLLITSLNNKDYKFSKDEVFKRIKITTFVQLLVQVYKLANAEEFKLPTTPDETPRVNNSIDGDNDDDNKNGNNDVVYGDDPNGDVSNRSTLLGVSQGIGEYDRLMGSKAGSSNNNKSTTIITGKSNGRQQLLLKGGVAYSLNNQSNCPYLLMDIREKDEYDQCHIVPAISYPKSMLSRSVNYESKEMLEYKNKEGRIVIVYDEDEKYAQNVATTLFQRGYDNVFMLSGGLKVASKLFPDGLITGTLPVAIATKQQTRKNGQQQPEDSAKTLKTCLDDDDVDKLEMYLNSQTAGSSTNRSNNSSRMSTCSGSSGRTSSSLSSAFNNGGRPAFKP